MTHLLHDGGQPRDVLLEQLQGFGAGALERCGHLPQLRHRPRRQEPRDGVERRRADGVAVPTAAVAGGEADAELAAAEVVAVEVAAGAARRLVVGVLDEGVTLALPRGLVGGEAEGADGPDQLAGVAELRLRGVVRDVADEHHAAAAAVGGGGGKGHGAVHGCVEWRMDRRECNCNGWCGGRIADPGYKASNKST
nr:unnamed protein product [Digitaria exilis]